MFRMTLNVCLYACLIVAQSILSSADCNAYDKMLGNDLMAEVGNWEQLKWNALRFDLTTNCLRSEFSQPQPLHSNVEAPANLVARRSQVDALIGQIVDCRGIQVSQNTCPSESELSKSTEFDPHEFVSSLAAWKSAHRFLADQNQKLVATIETLAATVGEFGQSLTVASYDSSIAVVKNGDWTIETKAFPRKQVVVTMESHRPIQYCGSSEDAYWQYYDDCNRWGVDFSYLLVEAANVDSDVAERMELATPSLPLISVACVTLINQWNVDLKSFAQNVAFKFENIEFE